MPTTSASGSNRHWQTLTGAGAYRCDFEQDSELLAGVRITIGAWVLGANLQDELKGFAELAHADKINAACAGDLLERQAQWLEHYQLRLRIREQGSVVSVGDGIAWITGLPSAAMDEILSFEDGSQAMVFDLTEGLIGAVLLHDTETPDRRHHRAAYRPNPEHTGGRCPARTHHRSPGNAARRRAATGPHTLAATGIVLAPDRGA